MLTANIVAANILMTLANQLRAGVVADQKIEGWKPSDHAHTQDAEEIEDLANLILMDVQVEDILKVMQGMDISPREKLYDTVPEPVWNSIGITFGLPWPG